MKLNFINLPQDYLKGVIELQSVLKFKIATDGIPVAFKIGDGLKIKYNDGRAEITVEKKHWFFRALGLLCENLNIKDKFEIKEQTCIKKTGLMVDASRNAVMTVAAIKELIRYIATMGYGMITMYTEDTYEVKEYPYFGWMRGRYTFEEMKECDDYADLFGIEMMPYIQTISHLEQFLRWKEMSFLKDTDNTLLVGSEETYKFIEAEVKAASAPFRSKRIHIGMDESWDLGRGKYLTLHGLRDQTEIFCEHLNKVAAIVKNQDLEPIIWYDSFCAYFRDDGKFNFEKAEQNKHLITEGVSLSDTYYGEYPDGIRDDLKFFLTMNRPLSFGGGLWNWQGHYPEWDWAYENIEKSVNACHDNNINEYVMSSWGNDGHECDPFAILPGLLYTSQICFNAPTDTDTLRQRFSSLFDGDYDAFYDMHNYQNDFSDDSVYRKNYSGFHLRFTGKKYMWNDPMEGLADFDVIEKPISAHYKKYADRFEILKDDQGRWGYLYKQAYNVFNVLAQKTHIAERLVPAYKANDKAFLKQVADELFPNLKNAIQELWRVDREVWMSNRKVFGWSLQDLRYGGLTFRIDTGIERINQYLNGELETLADLDEQRMHAIGGGGFSKYTDFAYPYRR